jgi:hypothetical protein
MKKPYEDEPLPIELGFDRDPGEQLNPTETGPAPARKALFSLWENSDNLAQIRNRVSICIPSTIARGLLLFALQPQPSLAGLS